MVLAQTAVVLQDALSKRLTKVEGLKHGVGVARVAKVLQAKVPLAVGNVATESFLELCGVVSLRRVASAEKGSERWGGEREGEEDERSGQSSRFLVWAGEEA